MELTEILASRAIRLFQLSKSGGGAYIPDLIKRIATKYDFAIYPADIKILEENHLSFKHGKFQNKLIDELKIYNDGIIVDTKNTVEDADALIDDLINWALETYQYSIKSLPPVRRYYHSHLEVRLDLDIDEWLSQLKPILEQINFSLKESGTVSAPFHMFGFSMHFDIASASIELPGAFNFERRFKQPFEYKIYSTVAPLRTKDHIDLIKKIEEMAK